MTEGQTTTTVGGDGAPQVTISGTTIDTSGTTTQEPSATAEPTSSPQPTPTSAPELVPASAPEPVPTNDPVASIPPASPSAAPASSPAADKAGPQSLTDPDGELTNTTMLTTLDTKLDTPELGLQTMTLTQPDDSLNLMAADVAGGVTTVDAPPADLSKVFVALPGTFISQVLNAVTAFFAPIIGPGAPAENPLLWGLLAWVRRQFNHAEATVAPMADLLTTSQPEESYTAISTMAALAAATNSPPTITRVAVGTPTRTGVVTGRVYATDPDRDPLTYSIDGLSAKGGTVTIDSVGRFRYTPTPAARHGAAATTATTADKTDTFTVVVADGQGNVVTQMVTVKLRPANVRPTGAAAYAGQPDRITGVIIGAVTAFDADNDFLTLSGPATTQKGSITYDSAAGTFTYTPTAAARAAANAPGASNATKTDSFTITLNDGHGGTTTASATVNLADPPNQTQYDHVPSGAVVMGTTGVGYQLLSNGSNATHVVLVRPDGTASVVKTLSGLPTTGGLVAAPGGGMYLVTQNYLQTQVSYISPTGAVISSKALAGIPGDQITLAPDGTGYVTVGKFSGANGTQTVVVVKPTGTITTHSVYGATREGVVVGPDGNAYQGYRYSGVAKVLAIAPDGTTRTLSANSGETLVGVAAGPNGTAYLTTADTDASGNDVTNVYVITGSGISTPRVLTGAADYPVVVGANGTAYQVTQRRVGFGYETYISVITATGATTSAPIKGIPAFAGDSGDQLQVAADGTGYMMIDGTWADPWGPSGVVVVRPNASVQIITGIAFHEVDEVLVGPDNKLYVTRWAGDTLVITPTGTSTTISIPGGSMQLVFGPNGTPFQAFLSGAGIGFKNLATLGTSALISDNSYEGDGELLSVAANGTVYLKTYDGEQEGEIPTVTVLAATSNGTTIATMTDTGEKAYVTVDGLNGAAYVTVIDADETTGTVTTKVWQITSTGATQIATYPGAVMAGVTVAPSGKLYLMTFEETSSQLRVITPPTAM